MKYTAAFAVAMMTLATLQSGWAQSAASIPKFEISFPSTIHPQKITGRLFLMISRTNEPEVRLQDSWFNSPEILGVDVNEMEPDQPATIDEKAHGYPFRSMKEVPPGEYYVQASLNPYIDYHRADGHVVWARDQWEGFRFTETPGTLYSKVEKVHIGRAESSAVKLELTSVVAPLPPPADTEWVKHIRIQSSLLTRFWGRPFYLGAVVLLPNDYSSHPDTKYPVIYQQQEHFSLDAPLGFNAEKTPETREDQKERESLGFETGYEFYQSWSSDHFPRMIAVTFQTPTPYGDWSTVTNSVNNGPYDDAVMTELIPYIEQHFRIQAQPQARVLIGKGSGGRDALALQVHHPDFFAGGAWMFFPWPFDYQRWFTMNLYENKSIFVLDPADSNGRMQDLNPWLPLERTFARTLDGQPLATTRQLSVHDAVMGGVGPGGEFGAEDALNGPIGANGYPVPLWNKETGEIDQEVAQYWRKHGDLADYTISNWPAIGPKLVGKLHFYIGESDEFFKELGVHHFENALKNLQNPAPNESFEYGLNKGHGWQPMTNAELVKVLAEHVPKSER